MRKIVGLTVALVIVAAGVVAHAGGFYSKGADATEVLRVKYTPSSSTYTSAITIASTAVTIVGNDVAGSSGTISLTPTKTLAQLVASINSITNSSEAKCFEAEIWGGISTDTVSNTLVAASSTTITPKRWVYHGKWDTSAAKHYDIVPQVAAQPNVLVANGKIAKIGGEPDGTGNVTVGVYEDDTLVWKQVIASPYYVLPASWVDSGTNMYTNSYTAVNTVTLDCEPNVRMASDKRYLIRATRATTATTGLLTAETE